MVPKRLPDEKSETGMFEKNVLTSAGLPDGMRHPPLDRGIRAFFVPRRCFTKNEDWNRLGLKRRSQYEPTRQYEYAPAYSEGPVSGLKGRAYFSKRGGMQGWRTAFSGANLQ